MRYAIFVALCAVSLASSPTRASAEEEQGEWRYRFDLETATSVFGYESAYILSRIRDSTEVFDAANEAQNLTRFGGRIVIQGAYASIDLRLYTLSVIDEENELKLSVGGLEAWLILPVYRRFAAGFYHHSAHNFNKDAYGYGIELNSVFLRQFARVGSLGLPGGDASFDLGFDAHFFIGRDNSPYLFTEDAKVFLRDIDDTTWRTVVHLDVEHPKGRSDSTVTVNGDGEGRMASVKLDLPVMMRVGPIFFGEFGKHLFVGPYVSFGWNLYETEVFGEIDWSAGVRLDMLVVDTTTH